MRTYRGLFRTPEFAPLFGASRAQVAATTLTGLALATLVYARTDSPLLSALSMFGPSFAGLIGTTTMPSVADRVPPRAAMTLVALAPAVALVLFLPVDTTMTVLAVASLAVTAMLSRGLRLSNIDGRARATKIAIGN